MALMANTIEKPVFGASSLLKLGPGLREKIEMPGNGRGDGKIPVKIVVPENSSLQDRLEQLSVMDESYSHSQIREARAATVHSLIEHHLPYIQNILSYLEKEGIFPAYAFDSGGVVWAEPDIRQIAELTGMPDVGMIEGLYEWGAQDDYKKMSKLLTWLGPKEQVDHLQEYWDTF